MSASQHQLGLFETVPDRAQADHARTRMRDMIERVKSAIVPPWKDQMAVILDDGAFQRAMQLVPADEAQALWAEFDAHTERLYAVWVQTQS